jgi:hypothetical protein
VGAAPVGVLFVVVPEADVHLDAQTVEDLQMVAEIGKLVEQDQELALGVVLGKQAMPAKSHAAWPTVHSCLCGAGLDQLTGFRVMLENHAICSVKRADRELDGTRACQRFAHWIRCRKEQRVRAERRRARDR